MVIVCASVGDCPAKRRDEALFGTDLCLQVSGLFLLHVQGNDPSRVAGKQARQQAVTSLQAHR